MAFKIITPEEAASYINDGAKIGFGGFTASGTPKVVSSALAQKAEAEHAAGRPFKVSLFTGASSSDMLDGVLARAKAVKFRTPYQSNKSLREAINANEISYVDMHLSQLAQCLRYGFFGKLDFAIVEASKVYDDGRIIPCMGVGIAPTVCDLADKVIIELNHHIPEAVEGFHDIYQPADPPYRREIPVYTPKDRIGTPYIKVDPSKIIGIVESNLHDGVAHFTEPDEVTTKIGANVCDFLVSQLKKGLIPSSFLPIQSGVGNIANAVLGGLGSNPDIPPFMMYTEVVQDSVVSLMKSGKCVFASGSSLTVSDEVMDQIISDVDFFRDKIVLRPQEISNNPEVVRRLGLITINTAIEADIFGNINSTHITGTKMMNGIGGSGDFTRNAYLSIFTCPSEAKGGKISAIVPMVSHLDHSEHSVSVVITEQGIADLRGKSPREKAEAIIENCAHPSYRPLLREYLKLERGGQTPHSLDACFEFHKALMETGDMHNSDFSKYTR
ncbi:MAG: acetyl-CoA hydrolase/transferase family protein [Bacteroidetes bacterium]|uniref:Acetyl-CoA hydrolase/transferase family protein n=1 Tax=Candidatus Caccoplasma merdipullorum TaxID=2840718 RepID=A0A9D9H784_9BACT|nr:acetyl-CoA hydrolase/transferase family protein [Candidatus Caccoplasma merdipullorum]